MAYPQLPRSDTHSAHTVIFGSSALIDPSIFLYDSPELLLFAVKYHELSDPLNMSISSMLTENPLQYCSTRSHILRAFLAVRGGLLSYAGTLIFRAQS